MIRKNIRINLILSLFLVSLWGLGIHFRAHSPAKVEFGYVPLIAGIISVLIIPLLFAFRKSLHLAYILNGFIAIIGFITMTHFIIALRAPIYLNVALVIVKFLLGKAIFDLEIHSNLDVSPKFSWAHYFRYPSMGYWYVHLVLLSAVYALGHLFWR